MKIYIKNLQKKIHINPSPITHCIKRILKYENIEEAVLSFVFVTAQRIRFLNAKYLDHHYVTDVITFDYSDGGNILILDGEIIISTDAVCQNARTFKTSQCDELGLYVIHGILHLIGYEDGVRGDRIKMRNKEKEILKYLGHCIKTLIV